MFKLSRKNIIILSVSVVLALILGIVTGYVLVFQKKVGLPEIKGLEDIKRVVMTTVYDDQGKLIKEFASEEKRRLVSYKDIPEVLKNAIITSEDNNYYDHWGINFRGLIRAIYGKAIGVYKGGGSSITQQLARNIYLTQKFSYARKLKEQLRAIQLEKKYSKEQILTYYCNKIYFGGSIYGVGEAAGYYFGKNVQDLTLPEAVTLTVLIPTPSLLYKIFQNRGNVEKGKALLLRKRNYILDKMAFLGYINNKQRDEAKKSGLPVKPHIVNEDSIGDFYIEEVRRYLLKKYGYDALYSGGLKVHTGLNMDMQTWAEDALRAGVRDLDKRQGWRQDNKLRNILDEKKEPETFELPEWKKEGYFTQDAIVNAVVTKVSNSGGVELKLGEYTGKISAKSARWTRYSLRRILKKGDITLAKIAKIDEEKKSMVLTLEQTPKAQAAIMVIDNKTGAVKAMVGGYSFSESEWNNATQALRQTGSTFKPIVFAAALENGYSPATIIDDSLKVFDNEWTIEPYEPSNHGDKFRGPVTLRYALEKSINVVTAKMVERLTPPMVVQYAKKFGITSELQPVMSMGLGTLGVSLKEMTAAYTVFPNNGIRVNPYYIEKIVNQNRRVVEKSYAEKRRVLDRPIAYIMNYIMQGVVQYGTGVKAKYLRAPVGGKTGTTDDYSDAWFIGFSPSVTVGVWVGYQGTNESLGDGEEGSRAAAPIFVKFMEKYLEQHVEPMEYPRPKGVVFVKIDKMTGKLLTPGCVYPFSEAFLSGTEPHEYCSEEDHLNIVDYYNPNGYDVIAEEKRKKKIEKEEQERKEREAAENEAAETVREP